MIEMNSRVSHASGPREQGIRIPDCALRRATGRRDYQFRSDNMASGALARSLGMSHILTVDHFVSTSDGD